MPLTNKYLKYSPEITLEIFTKIWDKLLDCEWTNTEATNVVEEYEAFSNEYPYLSPQSNKTFYSIENYPNNHKETTVQELLGYDPFVKDWSKASKEELLIEAGHRYPIGTKYECNYSNGNKTVKNTFNIFKYPEDTYITDGCGGQVFCKQKWAEIISLPEIKSIKSPYTVGKIYRVDKSDNDTYLICKFEKMYDPERMEGYYIANMNNKSSFEFTHDTPFIGKGRKVSDASKEECKWLEACIKADKFIDKSKVKEVIPEYVECVEKLLNTEIGRIYKVSGSICFCENNREYFWKTREFKPSTKEAYDAQDQPKQSLKIFPSEGYCEKNPQIIEYLSKTKTIYDNSIGKENDNRFNFICWNEKYYWITVDKSSKTYFSFTDVLTIIQQNKQNKEVMFEIGKWYKIKTAYSWIIKYRDTINGQIKADWYCEGIPGKKVEKDGSWGSEPTEVKELSLEEIQQYLPCGHPDLFTSSNNNQEFKVGDWVTVKKFNIQDNIGKCYYKINETFQILGLEKSSSFDWNWIWKIKGKEISSISCEFATLEEINSNLAGTGQIYIDIKTYPIRDRSTDDLSNYGLPTEPPSYMYEMEQKFKYSKGKSNLLLSIDDDDLPMVDIIKTKIIKQLLNND
jgi:hypothetical protein